LIDLADHILLLGRKWGSREDGWPAEIPLLLLGLYA